MVVRRKTRGARVGDRAKRVVSAVLRATLAELGEVGYAALRIENVAERARVNKTTVYRRWPTKPSLVGAAMRLCSTEPMPDTGSIRSDLVALGKQVIALMRSPDGTALMRMMGTDWQHPDIADLSRQIRGEMQRSRAKLVERAIARGELPKGSDPELIVDAVISPLFGRLKHGVSVDGRLVARFADLVLTGARHGGARARRGRRK